MQYFTCFTVACYRDAICLIKLTKLQNEASHMQNSRNVDKYSGTSV